MDPTIQVVEVEVSGFLGPASRIRAGSCCPPGQCDGPSTRAVPCLGRAKFAVFRAGQQATGCMDNYTPKSKHESSQTQIIPNYGDLDLSQSEYSCRYLYSLVTIQSHSPNHFFPFIIRPAPVVVRFCFPISANLGSVR